MSAAPSAPPVLIVEDDPDVSASLQLLVENYFDIPSVVVDDGTQAIRQALALRPRLVILDLALPTLDGFQVCARLKSSSETRATPVIGVSLSPWGYEETRRRVVAAGFDAFFHKLYDFHRLIPLLAHYLGSSTEDETTSNAGEW
jgi:DNA-binding response OmpR family regulator